MTEYGEPTPSQHVFPDSHGGLSDGPVRLSDGSTAVLTLDGVVRLWDPAGQPLGEPIPVSAIWPARELAVVYDRDGRELLACVIQEPERQTQVVLLDPATRRLVTAEIVAGIRLPLAAADHLPEPTRGIGRPLRLSDEEIVVPVGSTLHVWHVPTLRRIRSIPGDYSGCLAMVGNLIASAHHDTVQFRDSRTGSLVGEPLTCFSHVFDLEWFDNEGVLAISDMDGLHIWESGRVTKLADGRLSVLARVPGQPILLSEGEHTTIRLWNLATGENSTIQTDQRWVVFAAAAGMIVSGSEESDDVQVWDIESGVHLGTIPGKEPLVGTNHLVAVGNLVAQSRIDGLVQLWDPATRSPVGDLLQGHVYEAPDCVIEVNVLPHNDSLITAGCDGTIRLWPI